MATLAAGAFDRGMTTARRGFERSGLASALGQDPLQRRVLTPFGDTSAFSAPNARSDFSRGGILGQSFGGRSQFGGGILGSSASVNPFANYTWNEKTGFQPGAAPTTGGNPSGAPTGNALLDAAASAKGVPPAVLAAMVNRESSGDWDANNRIGDVGRFKPDGSIDHILPYVGIFETTAQSWGLDWNAMVGNQQAQLDGMATILNGIKQQQGFDSWTDTAAYYFAGPNYNNPDWGDELGMTVGQYRSSFDADVANYGGSTWSGSGTGASGNAVVDLATQYVGVRYQWGGIPGANQNPWDTGWDCSGMVSWLAAKEGVNIPNGSHYQYQWAQDNGRLYNDPAQLKPGDLIFMDSGFRGGGGSELNGASHVGMYIGNGQMIQAANESIGTVITSMSDPYYSGIVIGYGHMDWSGGSGVPSGTSSNAAPSQGVQAVNGAYYSPNYQIPTRWSR
jgi:cell wall-associated NlpC family hydrolase